MIELDPAETFRLEASDLLDSLEAALLDLGQTPQDGDLIDAAFRALHTIKGSGAMFGFDRVAAFTHDFETAFDLIRKGRISAKPDIISVSLSAKDYIRSLIEDPDSTDAIIGDAIVEELQSLIAAETGGSPGATERTDMPVAAGADDNAGWRVEFAFEPDILRNGTNPLALLDELRALGPCRVAANLDGVPELAALDPETCMVAWTVEIGNACPREDIEDVFMFVRGEMKLTIAPLDAADLAASPSDTAGAGYAGGEGGYRAGGAAVRARPGREG